MYIFESFRNALLFLGFGTGFLGFQDVFVTYDRTITLPDIYGELGDLSTSQFYKAQQNYGQQQGYNNNNNNNNNNMLRRLDLHLDAILPEAASASRTI